MSINLDKIPLFVGMQENDLHALAAKALIRTFAKNATVINEGELTGSLYVVLSGKVKVFLADESGKEIILDIKGPGGYFGEMALDDQARSASIVTLEPSQFAVFSRADFKHLLLEHPEVSQHVITDLIHVVRRLNKNVRGLTMLNVYGRVSKLLLDLAVDQKGTLVISEKLTKQDMANRVGSSREMISRIFRGLATRGYIKVEGKKLTIEKTLPAHL
jgi:CRP/FNR family cyclic AMP-dependent transcriptional regulator